MSNNSVNNQTYDADFIANRQAASAGTTCFIAAVHNDAVNAGSSAQVVAQSQAASGADAYHVSALASTRAWCHGIDASDAGALKETTFAGGSTSPSTGTLTRKVTTAGEQTMPLQPVFFAQLSANDANVTGAGAAYLLGTTGNVLTVNQQGTSMSTLGVFTFPVTGWYELKYNLIIDNLTAAMTNGQVVFYLNGGATQLVSQALNIGAIRTPGNAAVVNGSIFFNAAAAATMQISLTISNGAGNTAQVRGTLGGVAQSWFSGALIC